MTDLAVVSRPPMQRVRYEDLGEPPPYVYDLMLARSMLKPPQLAAYLNLVYALWFEGRLPVGLKALATKAGVGPKAFERMAPALSSRFDHAADGRWRNLDLEDERARRLGCEPGEEPQEDVGPARHSVDTRLSQIRSEVGSRGGKKTQSRRREQALRLVPSQSGADQFASSAEANIADPATKSGEQNGAFATSTPENLEANASRSHSLSVCLVETLKQTDKQTNDPRERASDTTEANVEAKTPSDTEAKASKQLADDCMVAALVKAGEGKFDAVHASGRLAIFREWIGKGVSFELDILSSIGEFARTNDVVKHCGNSAVRDMAFARRDHRLKLRATSPHRVLTFADPLLNKLAEALTEQIGADATASWFGDMSIAGTDTNSLTLAFPKPFTRKHVEANFEAQVRAAARMVDPRFGKVLFTIAAVPTSGIKGVGGSSEIAAQ